MAVTFRVRSFTITYTMADQTVTRLLGVSPLTWQKARPFAAIVGVLHVSVPFSKCRNFKLSAKRFLMARISVESRGSYPTKQTKVNKNPEFSLTKIYIVDFLFMREHLKVY